jgi:hypothetical protein
MPPIPIYLIFFTFILVIIPSIATIFYRLALYQHLVDLEEKVRRLINKQSPGQKPKIIEELEFRFSEVSSNLEHVNTGALIDQVYSREKVKRFTCEQIDYFCRILPNLLLAFGLLGTFFGITLNLAALSQTINQTNTSNVSGLVAELKRPLEGMSIAFITSLTGLFFSTALTVFNWLINTAFARYKLISCLEDYLDNVYQPQVQGDTRLDKIVNKMVSQQDEFLTRFGSTVRDAVEQSLGSVAQQIAKGNKEATDLAKLVYESFYQAAGTISAAANEFERAIDEMNAKSYIFKQSAEIFAASQFPQQLSAATENLASTQAKFSQSAVSLAETTRLIERAVVEVQLCSEIMIKLSEDIKSVNQTSSQVLELHQSHQSSLGEIIPQLKQGANSFSKATNKLNKLELRIGEKADSLNAVELALRELLSSVNKYTVNVSNKIDGNNHNFQIAISKTEDFINQLMVKLDTLTVEMQLIQSGNANLTQEYQKIGDRLLMGIDQLSDIQAGNTTLFPNQTNSNSPDHDLDDILKALAEE